MRDVPTSEEAGARLAAQAARLELLLHHLSGRAVRARVEVDDLLQEVFLRALADTASWPGGDSAFYRWLAQIARHTVIDVARALRAHKRDAKEVPLVRSDWSHFGLRESHVGGLARGPATEAGDRELAQGLVRAFQRLSPEHRRVIGLRQFESLSAAETARRMGRSESAVHSLYRRALTAWSEAQVGLS